jgi:hypothetical protein
MEIGLMKFAVDRNCSETEKAARKLIEIANSVEAVQDGRIYIELTTDRFYPSSRPVRSNTKPASICRSPGAGCGCMSPART